MYNQGMGEVDLDDQKTTAYHLDYISSIRFYLHVRFDLTDVTSASSFIFCNMQHCVTKGIPFNFKIIVNTYLIGRYTSKSRALVENKNRSKRK